MQTEACETYSASGTTVTTLGGVGSGAATGGILSPDVDGSLSPFLFGIFKTVLQILYSSK